jgi:hypothetical protein
MPKDYVRSAAFGCALVLVFTMTITSLTLLAASPFSRTAASCVQTVTEQKPDSETSRPSPSQTESGIDI